MPRSIGQTRCGRSSYRIVAAQPVTPKTVAFPFPSTQYDPVEFVLFRNGGEKMRRYHHIGIPTSQPRPRVRHIVHLKTFIVGQENSELAVEWIIFEVVASLPNLVRQLS